MTHSKVKEKKPRAAPRTIAAVHPLFFAVFAPLSLYASNVGQVPWPDVVRPLLLSIGAMCALFLVARIALRQIDRAAAVVTAILFLFFSYGHFLALQPAVAGVLVLFSSNATQVNPNAYLLPIWSIVLLAIIYFCVRSRRNFRPVTAILNVVGLVSVSIPLWLVCTSGSRYPGFAPVLRSLNLSADDNDSDTGSQSDAVTDTKHHHPTRAEPDIYYIILDAYGRQDVLKKYYDYDNQPFLSALEQRGFFVARRARPNYGQTIESISSSLNMTYLDKVAEKVGEKTTNLSALTVMVDRNAVAAFLRQRGYKFVSISTGFGLTSTPSADVFLGGKSSTTSNVDPFEGLLMDLTPLALVPRTNQTLYDQHRASILAGFENLGRAARLPYRKFVFAHILVPHPPFVFGPNGETTDSKGRPFSLADGSDWMHRGHRAEYRARYINQLKFANSRMLGAIDAILAKSRVRPIIIVQGDHGPRQLLDWRSLKNSDVRETYGNLNAFELPDGEANKVFYDSISPVNSFQLLFNHVFGAHFEQLPDRSYYSTLDLPFKFTDVTNASSPGAGEDQ